jgi:hypothetical protein
METHGLTGAPSGKELSTEQKRALLKELLLKRSQKADCPFSLSQGQRALWFLQKIDPASCSYNIAIPALFRPGIRTTALEAALPRLLERHPALRTVFSEVSGQPSQHVLPSAPATVRQFTATEAPAALLEQVLEDYRRPFDMEQPLFRFSLFHKADGSDVLLITVHHLVFDAASALIVFEDLRRIYEAEISQTSPILAAPSAHYADYVRWQQTLMAGPLADELWKYWQTALSGTLPVLCFGPAPGAAGTLPLFFENDFANEIRALARRYRTTLYTVLLAALQCALHLKFRAIDILIGSPVSARTQPQWVRTAGYFINMLPLRCSISSRSSFSDHLAGSRQCVLGALQHQDFPFPAMVERLRQPRRRGAASILQVMFNLMATGYSNEASRLFTAQTARDGGRFGDSTFTAYPIPQQEGQFELVLEMADVEGHLSGNLKHGASVSVETAESLARIYRTVLEAVVGNPDRRISGLLSNREDLVL